MKLKIAVLAGDGIGPEIMKQGVAVMNAIAKRWWVPVLLMPVATPILMRLMMYACVLMQSCSLLLAT